MNDENTKVSNIGKIRCISEISYRFFRHLIRY